MFTKSDIEKYFTGEKSESLIFIALGMAGIILAILFFFFFKTSLHKGMAVPFACIGLIMGITGLSVYRSSDRLRIENVYAYDMNPLQLKEKELPRMKKVMKNFQLLRWVEIFLLAAGLGLYIYFIRDFRSGFWRGFGFALAVMAVVALTADYFAERRGKIYIRGLESFVK